MTSFFIYARKSTESEDRQALSIEAQLCELKSLARREQLTIVKVFTESQSAKNSDRPVFRAMIEELQDGRVSGVLCWKLDRLTRNLLDAAKISDLLEKGTIEEIKTPMQTYRNNGIDRLMSGIDFLFARKFIDDLSENVKRGLKMKVKQGWMPGRAPIGYLNDQADKGCGKIIPDLKRFPLIRKMWDMMLSGNHSVPKILEIANEQWGFKTRRTKRVGAVPLSRSTLYKVFSDPFYYGRFMYQGELHRGKHKPMVTYEEFERVQYMLGTKDKPKPKKHSFAFTGMFRCGQCKSLITAERKFKLIKSTNLRNSYVYYHCTHGKDRSCRQGSITDNGLLSQVDQYLSRISIPQEYLNWIFKYYDSVLLKEQSKDEDEQRSIKEELLAIDKKLQNLVNLKIAPDNEFNQLLSDGEFLQQKSKLTQEKLTLESSLNHYNETSSGELLDLTKKTFELAAYARIWFVKGDNQRRRTIIRSIFSNREISDRKVLLTAKKPFELISNIQFRSIKEYWTIEPMKFGLHNTRTVPSEDGSCAQLRELDDIRTEISRLAKVFPQS